jgi:hypothetical protein
MNGVVLHAAFHEADELVKSFEEVADDRQYDQHGLVIAGIIIGASLSPATAKELIHEMLAVDRDYAALADARAVAGRLDYVAQRSSQRN